MYYWENEGLPDDDYVLAKIAGMRIEDWRRNRASIRRNFIRGWGHPRINRMLTGIGRVSVYRPLEYPLFSPDPG
jgi:uncharacterized protein YdaU (DUF1376 family)